MTEKTVFSTGDDPGKFIRDVLLALGVPGDDAQPVRM